MIHVSFMTESIVAIFSPVYCKQRSWLFANNIGSAESALENGTFRRSSSGQIPGR